MYFTVKLLLPFILALNFAEQLQNQAKKKVKCEWQIRFEFRNPRAQKPINLKYSYIEMHWNTWDNIEATPLFAHFKHSWISVLSQINKTHHTTEGHLVSITYTWGKKKRKKKQGTWRMVSFRWDNGMTVIPSVRGDVQLHGRWGTRWRGWTRGSPNGWTAGHWYGRSL